jgi:thiol-disulfide isomerase/thioredoxin
MASRAIALCLLILGGCRGGGWQAEAGAVGATVPEFSATSLLTGEQTSLGSLRGRIVLLNVWAIWCEPCRHEMPALEKVRSRYHGEGLEVIGVNIDGRGQETLVRTFSKAQGIDYPVWLDPDDRVSNQLGIAQLPTTLLIDRAGRVRWRRVGMVGDRDAELNRAISEALPKDSVTRTSMSH